ncbi:MAG TPA: O-antigen ligase family protein [Methylomirabilota bacterium]|nr:O-antigen ligase family protein [Methylomirabilota bacterium]
MKRYISYFKNLKLHLVFFFLFLFLLPVQSRALYHPESAYIGWYFNYHLAFFFYLTDILWILCLVTWLGFDPQFRSFFYPRFVLFWLILAFIIWVVISLFHVERIGLSVYQILKWIEFWGIAIYIWLVFKKQAYFIWSAAVIFGSAFLESVIGIWQFHVQHMVGLNWLGEYISPLGTPGLATIDTLSGKLIRAYGTFPHPNVFGAFLVFGLFMALYFSLKPLNLFNRALVACGTIIILVGIFVSFSRVAWLAGILALLGFMAYSVYKKDWINANLLCVIGVVSCATIGIFYPGLVQTRTFDSNPTSINDRTFFNHLGLELIVKHPVLGAGVGNYVPALEKIVKLEDWQYQPPHNIFIMLGAELGMVGLLIFFWILIEIFRRLKGHLSRPLVFSLSFLALTFLLMGQVDHYFVTIQQGRLMFAVVLGLLGALPNIYEPDQKNI